MASKSDRARKLERARFERRRARQAAQARKKRQVQASVGVAIAVVALVLGVSYFAGAFDSKPAQTPTAQGSCGWVPQDAAANPNLIDTGLPPTSGELRDGVQIMTIATNLGTIEAKLDLTKAPCTAASFKYLGEKNYYANSTCHRLNTTTKTLTCGDPKSTGVGDPSYRFADENLPQAPIPAVASSSSPSASPPASPSPSASAAAAQSYYARGTIVMYNSGASTNAGQFMIVYGDGSDLPPSYSIVGEITSGLDIVDKVAAAGATGADGKPVPEGKPSTALTIQSVAVGAQPDPSLAPSPSTSASPTQ